MMMLAACYEKHGSVSKVGEIKNVPKPSNPGPGELLVKIHCASLNPADYKSAAGEQAAILAFNWPRVYGFDFAGVVEEVGDSVPNYATGDRVFGMIQGLPQRDSGTTAEYALVKAEICAQIPSNVSYADAAAVPLVAITAVKAFRACGLDSNKGSGQGPRVFITGGAGGVGSIAIQIAKCMFHASYVATTASPGKKTELCKSLGADRVVNYREKKFEVELKDEKFDAIFDCTGEAKRCVSLLQEGGGLTSIQACPTVECVRTWVEEAKLNPEAITFGVRPFLFSGFGGHLMNFFTGASRLRKQCEEQSATYNHIIGCGNGEIMGIVASFMEKGELKAVVDQTFPLKECLEALKYLKKGHAAGKVIIEIEK